MRTCPTRTFTHHVKLVSRALLSATRWANVAASTLELTHQSVRVVWNRSSLAAASPAYASDRSVVPNEADACFPPAGKSVRAIAVPADTKPATVSVARPNITKVSARLLNDPPLITAVPGVQHSGTGSVSVTI